MAKIEFPRQLDELLAGSELFAPIRAFADKAGEILADNKLTFFPDYTDHGIEHVNRVLKTEVELVPKGVWEKSKEDSDPRLLCNADAAIIIGATILHDIAMHLYPEGFKELIRKDSRFKPLKWFDLNYENYTADIPWFELWENYTREARRFSERQLSNIIGEKSASVWKFDKLPDDPGSWELNHRLIIGEFIRRHHARLAHEIAMYGFPGIPSGTSEGQFPAIGEDKQNSFKRIADLIGLTARSHGISLRVCNEYLDKRYHKLPRPAGSAVLYPMVLLRIADYFQIDQARAPAVLLQLRDPQSPVSVQEWQKHQAVESIGPANDPRGRMVIVSNDISLPLYLQLKELLESLQAEIDQSTAVLDEMYGIYSHLGLDQLNLAVRRVHSNLQTPAFVENLKYVPVKSGFSTDPNLLSLLVEPLYGNHPGVGVRELMQNAVDAVCEQDAWCKKHNQPVGSLDLPELGCDVLIEFEKMDNGRWILRVQDRGIGMTSDTIQNYFLRAGASFRHSAEWMQEFLDDDGKPRVARAGRFGIGAFAVFLLGSSFKLWTRHVNADKETGFSISAEATSQLIEIQKVSGLQIGTTIEVELDCDTASRLALERRLQNLPELKKKDMQEYLLFNDETDWFCWNWPKITKKIKTRQETVLLKQRTLFPIQKCKLPAEWSVIYPDGFDAVYWTFDAVPALSCNGFKIHKPQSLGDDWGLGRFTDTRFKHPCIAVVDSTSSLPLTMQRYELCGSLPFEVEIERDVIMSYIAYLLICGSNSQLESLSNVEKFPLSELIFKYNGIFDGVPIFGDRETYRCYSTGEGMVPKDAWLFTLFNSLTCVMYGVLIDGEFKDEFSFKPDHFHTFTGEMLNQKSKIGQVFFSWLGVSRFSDKLGKYGFLLFNRMAKEGVIGTDMITASDLLLSFDPEFISYFKQNNPVENAPFWNYISRDNTSRACFESFTDGFKSQLPLQQLLKSLEDCFLYTDTRPPEAKEFNKSKEVFLFVSELKIKTVEKPESTLAKIWNECLGPRYIPFDPVARAELIEHGRKHSELKRHIEAWEEMKRTGSKWATGEEEK